jgi:glycosyltransferase involved in cell wall biosynthesis
MNILAVSLAFPPLAYPRSIQVARLLKHIEASTVLFCADEPGARLDSTIEPDAEARLKACIRVPVAKGRVAALIDRSAYRFARGVWNRRNLVPDQYGGWGSAVLREVTRYINDAAFRPDVIVTFAQPFTGHLIGMELRSRLGIPWLAHFSDPWVDNPFMPFDEVTRRLNLELERSVAEKADMLVFTSAETVDLFYAKYPAELKKKARVLPQCFDPELFQDRRNRESGPISIRYLGNFYGQRTPEPLISGLAELSRTRPEILENVSFELIGSGDAEEVKALASSLPDGLMTVRPSVSYRESLDLMIDSDGLLIIDAPAETSVFLPSKLIDYIGAGRPIFGITPEGTAAALIREVDGLVADAGDIAAVSEGLCLFIERLKAGRNGQASRQQHPDAVRVRFKADRVSENFRQMLEELKAGC